MLQHLVSFVVVVFLDVKSIYIRFSYRDSTEFHTFLRYLRNEVAQSSDFSIYGREEHIHAL